MSTAAQVKANQQNSQSSTGPQTEEGKAAASLNNLRHGLRGKFTLLASESPEEFTTLMGAMRDEHQPDTITEELLVERMAEHEWLSRRAQAFMDQNLTLKGTDDPAALALWLRYQTTNDRGFHKCLAGLLKLRAEKRKEQIGFERQKNEEAEQARKTQLADARCRALNAQANLKEFDTELKAMLQAPLPGNSVIDFEKIKPFLNRALTSYFEAQDRGLL